MLTMGAIVRSLKTTTACGTSRMVQSAVLREPASAHEQELTYYLVWRAGIKAQREGEAQ